MIKSKSSFSRKRNENMEGWRIVMCGAVFAATFSILYLENSSQQSLGSASSRHLIIGVISARDHFLQRDAVRLTWGSQIANIPNAELIFVVGEHDCHIPPDYRISQYSCEKWNVHMHDAEDASSKFFVKKLLVDQKRDTLAFSCYTGIGFQILHPIILESFSLSLELLLRVGNATIVLQDAEEILESLKVSHTSCTKESTKNGYCVVKLSYPLLLPRLFEGELRVLDADISESEMCGKNTFTLQPGKIQQCQWTNSSVIRYEFLRSKHNVLMKWNEEACPLLSALYSVTERKSLKEHVEKELARRREWKNHFDFVLRTIAIEQVVNGDMMVLSHQDVYSKLSQKVMAFLKRSTLDFDYNFLMKVDDDTFVNVSGLKDMVFSEDYSDPKIWSRFHYHRAIPRHGKWADIRSSSLSYPSFPAGAGYLMSRM
ncbi:hypothetical protein SK128_009142 [Halocaridina rubra]|uniref:Hexosyltransferase n=1 Tax=Halocaridina rubra TaxID=373956 RepID=A0AAN8X415_HALRR